MPYKCSNGLLVSEQYLTEQYFTETILGDTTYIPGGLWAFGNNGSGQFGDNTVIDKSSPIQIS